MPTSKDFTSLWGLIKRGAGYFGIVHASVVLLPREGFPSRRKTLPCGFPDKSGQRPPQAPNRTLSVRHS